MTMRCISVVPSTICSIFACAMKRASGYSCSRPYAPSTSLQAIAARSAASGQKRLACAASTRAAPLVECGGGGAVEHAPGDDVGLDVGERELDGLQVEQCAAERLASACVLQRDGERLGGQPDGDRRDVDARDVDRAERSAHALARAARAAHTDGTCTSS